MTIARRKQLRLEVTPFYHCTTRCVRRSYLCGYDKVTRKNYDHRRGWIEDRLLLLSEAFCIDVLGYAVMHNHYHVVLKVDKETADSLDDDAVISRWLTIYRGTSLAQRHKAGEELNERERELLQATAAEWREELGNISRFMGNLNEHIARKANKEDDCKGVFWESRFNLQAVLDLPALLQTLCYVDLNPVRAKVARTPEDSRYTSVRRRLRHQKTGLMAFSTDQPDQTIHPFESITEIPISFENYLQLLDWTGRQLKNGKRGSIDQNAPAIMARLGFDPEAWVKTQTPQVSWKQRALGSVERIKEYCNAIGQQWIWQTS